MSEITMMPSITNASVADVAGETFDRGSNDIMSVGPSLGRAAFRALRLLGPGAGRSARIINRRTHPLPLPKATVDPAEVLRKCRVIAVVGASKNPEKDANTVPVYLMEQGYKIIPVNPTAPEIAGTKAYPTLADIPEDLARTVEVVDVFRPSEEFPEVARQVVSLEAKTGRAVVFWGQLGLENEDAKRILEGAGVDYVMDRCMRTEYRMLGIRK